VLSDDQTAQLHRPGVAVEPDGSVAAPVLSSESTSYASVISLELFRRPWDRSWWRQDGISPRDCGTPF